MLEEKQKNIDKLNSNNDLLQEQLQEYKQFKDKYKALEQDQEQLKKNNAALIDKNNKLDNTISSLSDKIKNNEDMIEFYKTNNIVLKVNIKASNAFLLSFNSILLVL